MRGDRDPWMDDALCAETDPEAFFPEQGGAPTSAKQICAACPVVQECLTYALVNGFTDGIWGGLSPKERRPLRRSAA